MADLRFHDRAGPFTAAALAARIGAEVRGEEDRSLTDVATVEGAGPTDLVYVDDKRYLGALASSRAGACILRPDAAERVPAGMALLLAAEPQRAFALAARAFYPPPIAVAGIAPSAAVDAAASVDPTAEVGPGAVVGPGASVGARSAIGANAVIGRNVRIGADCRIGANASVSHATIGDRVTLHAGVRVGQDGFGFVPGREGHLKIPQLGRVVIEDDVDVGANSTIDRGALGDTVIGRGCLIDNLVQIGHNVRLGRGCIIVAQVGISGSAVLGDFVMMGGQSGLTGHLSVGDGARVAAQSGVMRDVAAGITVCGSPAIPLPEFFRQTATLQRLARKKGA